MTTRRDFIRQGALFVAAAAIIEPRRLWAFPTNPLGRQGLQSARGVEMTQGARIAIVNPTTGGLVRSGTVKSSHGGVVSVIWDGDGCAVTSDMFALATVVGW